MPRTPSAATRWQAVIDDFHQAGLKQTEFCRRRGLSLHTFRKYLYGSQPTTAVTPHAKFLPLTTLVYAWELNNHMATAGINLLWLLIAVLIDLGGLGGGA